MQRVTMVVAILRNDEFGTSVDDAAKDGPVQTQQHVPDDPMDDTRTAPTAAYQGVVIVPSKVSNETADAELPSVRQVRSHVPSFCWHPPDKLSLRSSARLVWKRCLVAQRIRYPGYSPLALTQLVQSRKRKAVAATTAASTAATAVDV